MRATEIVLIYLADGIKSERMLFILIKLFTGRQFHINLNNIREATFIIISVK